MAEEIVWNKKLLVFSVLLGLLAAILFYVYDARMQKRLTGDTIQVLRWKRPLLNGEEIALADIDFPTIRKTFMKQLQGVLTRKDLNFVTGGVHVNRGVRRGDFVRFSDILESQTGSPSRNISEGMRAVTLRVDPSTTPGDMLWVNDRVDVVGLISVSGRPAKSYTIIENARVLAVGGRSQSPEEQFSVDRRGRRHQPGLRTYRSLTIEVTKKTGERLASLLPRIQGKIWVVLRPPPTGMAMDSGGEINPELEPLFKVALPAGGPVPE